MLDFTRTYLGGESLSHLLIGTNWVLGYSHTSRADEARSKQSLAPAEAAG